MREFFPCHRGKAICCIANYQNTMLAKKTVHIDLLTPFSLQRRDCGPTRPIKYGGNFILLHVYCGSKEGCHSFRKKCQNPETAPLIP